MHIVDNPVYPACKTFYRLDIVALLALTIGELLIPDKGPIVLYYFGKNIDI